MRKPWDKAKVEKAVQNVERRVLAPLRNRTFFSLRELNEAIEWGLIQYNERPFQNLEGSRRSLFEELDRLALRPLLGESYEYANWNKARLNIDYHVTVEGNSYSVPCQLVNQTIDIRLTATGVECIWITPAHSSIVTNPAWVCGGWSGAANSCASPTGYAGRRTASS